jgi:hypothetical protein
VAHAASVHEDAPCLAAPVLHILRIEDELAASRMFLRLGATAELQPDHKMRGCQRMVCQSMMSVRRRNQGPSSLQRTARPPGNGQLDAQHVLICILFSILEASRANPCELRPSHVLSEDFCQQAVLRIAEGLPSCRARRMRSGRLPNTFVVKTFTEIVKDYRASGGSGSLCNTEYCFV